jgi:hypothetical protein
MKITNKDKFAKLPDAILFDTDNTLYEILKLMAPGILPS